VDFALLQSLTRARTVRRHTPHEAAVPDGHTLLGFFAPTALQVTGSDRHRACLTRLCCVSRLSQPPDASFPPRPCRSCFVPAALLGFALQRVSLPIAGTPLGTPCPSWRSASAVAEATTRARPVPRCHVASSPAPRSEVGAAREGVAGFERASRGLSSNRKSVLRSAAVTPHDGSRSSPGIITPSRGFPHPALTRPLPRLPSCASGRRAETNRTRALQGVDWRGGWLVSLETAAPPGLLVLVPGSQREACARTSGPVATGFLP
jgi:hypothetical protein